MILPEKNKIKLCQINFKNNHIENFTGVAQLVE